MFRMHKTIDVITLFHKPSIQASTRIATLLKQTSAQSQETATEDQASDHSSQHTSREPFQLDITEAPPTKDQLRSIFEYVGDSKAAQLVKGASSQSDALKKIQDNPESFLRPVVSLTRILHRLYISETPASVADSREGRGLEAGQSRYFLSFL